MASNSTSVRRHSKRRTGSARHSETYSHTSTQASYPRKYPSASEVSRWRGGTIDTRGRRYFTREVNVRTGVHMLWYLLPSTKELKNQSFEADEKGEQVLLHPVPEEYLYCVDYGYGDKHKESEVTVLRVISQSSLPNKRVGVVEVIPC